MSAIDHSEDSLAGLTLDAVLGNEKPHPSSAVAPSASQVNRTLLDIIRDEEPRGSLFGHKDKKTWKAFRDRLRLKRAGAAWTSSIHIPTSDIPIQNTNRRHHQQQHRQRSLIPRKNSVRFTTVSTLNSVESIKLADLGDKPHPASSGPRPMMTRRSSTRLGIFAPGSSELDDSASAAPNIHAIGDMPPARSYRPQMSRHNSTRFPAAGSKSDDGEEEEEEREFMEERAMSAREAVAAQEAAEAEAARQAAAEEEEEEDDDDDEYGGGLNSGGGGEGAPVMMSLMDLLEETDRQMGFEGSRYTMGDDDYGGEYDEDEDEAEDSGVEYTCCVCMVRHKGGGFIPCEHTFCRLCSRELYVQRGYCPLCNGYILEILDIF